MTDEFAVFGLARRPGVDLAALKEKYLRLAAEAHPDSGGGDDEKFRAVQQAYRTLLDPALRLRHLLELEFGGWEKKSAPSHPELFMKVGEVLQRAKGFRQQWEKAQGALPRALLAQDRELVLRQVRDVVAAVGGAQRGLEGDLAGLDANWPKVEAGELARVAAGMTFLARWQAELAEMEFQLAHD